MTARDQLRGLAMLACRDAREGVDGAIENALRLADLVTTASDEECEEKIELIRTHVPELMPS